MIFRGGEQRVGRHLSSVHKDPRFVDALTSVPRQSDDLHCRTGRNSWCVGVPEVLERTDLNNEGANWNVEARYWKEIFFSTILYGSFCCFLFACVDFFVISIFLIFLVSFQLARAMTRDEERRKTASMVGGARNGGSQGPRSAQMETPRRQRAPLGVSP